MQDQKQAVTEEIKVTGASLMEEVKRLVHEGNVSHIIIKNEAGAILLEIPLTLGVVGVAVLPMLAAVGTIAVLAAHYTISVTRVPDQQPS